MLEIFVKKKRVIVNLILSIAWIVLSLLALMTSERRLNWANVLYLGIGLLYFIQYYYQLKKSLITITDEVIAMHSIFKSKTISINAVTEITYPFKDILIKSEDKKIAISKDVIDEKDYSLLEERLNSIKRQLAI